MLRGLWAVLVLIVSSLICGIPTIIASLVNRNSPSRIHWNVDKAHDRECLHLIAPEARGRIRFIY